MLAIGAKRGAAADYHFQVRAGLEQRRGKARRLRQQLFEVIYHEQGLPAAQMLDHHVQRQPVACHRNPDRLRDNGWNHFGIADRGERDEVDTIRKLVEGLSCDLQAQTGLTDAARSGQREQARRLDQPLRARHHLRAAHKAGQLGRKVIGCAVERAQRRKYIWNSLHEKLIKVLRPCEITQAVQAQVAQLQPLRKTAGHQRLGGLGHQHLAAVGRPRDPRGMMDVEPDVFVAHQRRFARVEADPDTKRATFRPSVLRERLLCRGGGVAGVERARKDAEERVAFGPQLATFVAAKSLAQQLVVDHLQLDVSLTELLHQTRRSLDVCEKKRDCPGGEGQRWGLASDGLSNGSSAAVIAARCSSRSKSRSGSGGSKCSVTTLLRRTYTIG